MNFWLASYPERVYAGAVCSSTARERGKRGVTQFYPRPRLCRSEARPVRAEYGGQRPTEGMCLDAEHEDNFRDQSVFSDGITIEDTMSVLVKYQNQCGSPTR